MDLLWKLPSVELWQVTESVEELLVKSDWVITSHNDVVTSRIGEVSWRLDTSLHCLKAEERSFVFAINPQEHIFYCVNLGETPIDEVAVLETILDSFTTYEVKKDERTKPDRTEQFINGLNKATTTVVHGMAATAAYIGKKAKQGAEKYKESRAPCENPRPVNEKTRQRIQAVRTIAKTTSGLTSAAVEAVAVFTSQAANAIVGDGGKSDPKKPSTKAKKVAAALVVSAAEIYESMVEAFLTVSSKTADAATDVVTHRFGEEVGQASKDSISAAGHAANAFVTSSRLGTKAILKSTAKKTAMEYMSQSGEPSKAAAQ